MSVCSGVPCKNPKNQRPSKGTDTPLRSPMLAKSFFSQSIKNVPKIPPIKESSPKVAVNSL